MSTQDTGCFSWCPFRRNCDVETETHVVTTKPEVISELKKPSAAPTTLDYAQDATAKTLEVLNSAAGLIPIPFIQQAIQVALKVLDSCKDVAAIEESVQGLQDRVSGLILVIVDSVTAESDSMESIRLAAAKIETDVKCLEETLRQIVQDLDDIKKQSRWLLLLFKDVNKSKIDGCMDRLAGALEKFNLSHGLRVLDVLNDIQARLNKVQNLMQNVSDEVGELRAEFRTGMSRLLGQLESVRVQKELAILALQPMPSKPPSFRGRDDHVANILRLLSDQPASHVCILGPGGMGKTSVALAAMEMPAIRQRFLEANRYWIPCISATSVSLFLEILYSYLRVGRDTGDMIGDIVKKLSKSTGPSIILLDNFETPWNLSGAQQQVGDILRRLAGIPQVILLMTMRGSHPPSASISWVAINLPPVDKASSQQIFRDNHPNTEPGADVDRLVEAVGNLPFAVTLLANLGKETGSSVGDLLEEWARAGTNMISPLDIPEQSMNKSISLSVDITKKDPDAYALLSALSMLPSGTTRDRLRWWTPYLNSQSPLGAIAALSRAALLEVNETKPQHLSVVPVVQSFMHQDNRISDQIRHHIEEGCCLYVLRYACRPYDSKFKENSAALAAESTNIQSILFALVLDTGTESEIDRLDSGSQASNLKWQELVFSALLAFSWHPYDTKPNLDFVTHTASMVCRSGIQAHIAEALFCKGVTYRRVGHHERGHSILQEAFDCFKALPPDSYKHSLKTECGLALARIMMYLQMSSEDIINLIQTVLSDVATASNDQERGLTLIGLGEAHWYANESESDLARSLPFLQEGQGILQRCSTRWTDIAHSLDVTSKIYVCLGQYYEALATAREALVNAERAGDACQVGDTLLVLADVLLKLNQDDQALQYLQRSLLIYEIFGAVLGLAQDFEYIGYVYLRRRSFQDAFIAYQAAVDHYESMSTMSMGQSGSCVCRDTLEKIRQKEAHPEIEIGFSRPDISGVDMPLLFL